MLSRHQFLSSAQRTAKQLRLSSLRAKPQRRCESTPASSSSPKVRDPADNPFVRERRGIKEHAAATSDLWRKISLYVVPPCLLIASINAWNLWNEHFEHLSHMPPMEERPQYSYLNIRSKAYPWGDGDKTLFWNPKYNYHKTD